MADVVVDTSTVVKWNIPEQHHEQARAIRDDFLNGKHDLFAPALMPFEAINALYLNLRETWPFLISTFGYHL